MSPFFALSYSFRDTTRFFDFFLSIKRNIKKEKMGCFTGWNCSAIWVWEKTLLFAEVTAWAAMQSRLQPELLCSRDYSLSCYAVEVTGGAAMQSRLQPELLCSRGYSWSCYAVEVTVSVQPELLCSRGYSLNCYAVEITAWAAMQSRLQPELLCSRGYSLSCYAVEVTAWAAMQSRLQPVRVRVRVRVA